MQKLLLVCLAGALGTGVRYAIGLWAAQRLSTLFPVATLIVNLVGCFLIAAVIQASLLMTAITPTLRAALTTGFMGGLTTYSAFNFETTHLWIMGNRRLALLNFTVTTVGCLVSGLFGLWVTRRVLGA